jgi:probable F420-dependent oxidoreductase
MKIGTSLSFNTMKMHPDVIRNFATSLDKGGIDYMTMAGHLLSAPPDSYEGRPPATYVGPFRDPFVLYSHLASITDRLEFATSIMIVPELPTAYVAKQAAELALLSNNRFHLGIGISWNEYEYEAMGQDVHRRGARLEAQLPLLKKLWSEPYVTHEDRFHRLQNIGIGYKLEKPVPLWVGSGVEEKLLRRVARHADGWMPTGDPAPNLPRLQQYLRDEGRDPATFLVMSRINGAEGDAGAWKAEAHRLKDLGVTHVTIGAAPTASPEQELETALRVREALASDGGL